MKTFSILIFVVTFVCVSTSVWGRPGNPDQICVPGFDVTTVHGVCVCTDDGKGLKCPSKSEHHETPESKDHEIKPLKLKTDPAVDRTRKQKEDRIIKYRKWIQEMKQQEEQERRRVQKQNEEKERRRIEMEKQINKYSDMYYGQNDDKFMSIPHMDYLKMNPIDVNLAAALKPVEYKPIKFRPYEFRPFEFHPII